MKNRIIVIVSVLSLAGTFYGHDLFLKSKNYHLIPHERVAVSLFNGTFETSENVITRARMIDVSIITGDGTLVHPDTACWRDEDTRAVLEFETGSAGTYVVGVSTAPSMIELSAEDFNAYLQHDGVLDVFAERKRDGSLKSVARERYSKHVKSILQVGSHRSDSYKTKLGYPVELIPLSNPYDLKVGDTLSVLFLRHGKPEPDQLIYASYAGYHEHNGDDSHREAVMSRTDESGIAGIVLKEKGEWYVRLVNMVKVGDDGVDYESNWATLTFEIR